MHTRVVAQECCYLTSVARLSAICLKILLIELAYIVNSQLRQTIPAEVTNISFWILANESRKSASFRIESIAQYRFLSCDLLGFCFEADFLFMLVAFNEQLFGFDGTVTLEAVNDSAHPQPSGLIILDTHPLAETHELLGFMCFSQQPDFVLGTSRQGLRRRTRQEKIFDCRLILGKSVCFKHTNFRFDDLWASDAYFKAAILRHSVANTNITIK